MNTLSFNHAPCRFPARPYNEKRAQYPFILDRQILCHSLFSARKTTRGFTFNKKKCFCLSYLNLFLTFFNQTNIYFLLFSIMSPRPITNATFRLVSCARVSDRNVPAHFDARIQCLCGDLLVLSRRRGEKQNTHPRRRQTSTHDRCRRRRWVVWNCGQKSRLRFNGCPFLNKSNSSFLSSCQFSPCLVAVRLKSLPYPPDTDKHFYAASLGRTFEWKNIVDGGRYWLPLLDMACQGKHYRLVSETPRSAGGGLGFKRINYGKLNNNSGT